MYKNELIKKELILDLAGAPFGGINPLMLTAPMCRLDLPLWAPLWGNSQSPVLAPSVPGREPAATTPTTAPVPIGGLLKKKH